jgi:hypothetical protein
VLICLCALAGFRTNWSLFRHSRPASKGDSPEAILARFEPLQRLIPDDAVLGFFVDERYADPKLFLPAGRLWLACYLLSPRTLDWSTDHALVIVDSGVPAPPPEMAQSKGWTLVADLHNGVRLFRTRAAQLP